MGLFCLDAEDPAQDPTQTFRAFDHDDLHPLTLSHVLPHYSARTGKRCSAQRSGRVSTTSSAPLRVETVMQSDPGAYSLLTPRG